MRRQLRDTEETTILRADKVDSCVPSDDSLYQRVMDYHNPSVVTKLEQKLQIPAKQADLLFTDTKLFLYLCGTVAGEWVPPTKIDAGWHEFLLFTEDYQAFCFELFGRFIHHRPQRTEETDGGKRQGLSLSRTLLAIRELLQIELSENWGPKALAITGVSPTLDTDSSPCGGTGSCSCGCSPCDSKTT